MPELPEVETVVRGLREERVCGQDILAARVSWARSVAGLSPVDFEHAIRCKRIADVQRRAKYIIIRLDPAGWLLVHLRMTGSLSVKPAMLPRDPHERVALVLGDGREIRFRDSRKFGRWIYVNDPSPILDVLGPEPLSPDFDSSRLIQIVKRHSRMLKPLLLDQRVLAGLGNIYVDEALWEARLHPCRLSHTLTTPDCRRLHAAIRSVLQRGVDSMGTTLGRGVSNFYSVAGHRGRNQDGLRVFRRHGEPCPHCGGIICRLIVGQRSTHICPRCQPAPRRPVDTHHTG